MTITDPIPYISKAVEELGDYLSRLGGAAVPLGRGLHPSEVYLYVLTRILELKDNDFEADTYLESDFKSFAEPALEKTENHIVKINLPKT